MEDNLRALRVERMDLVNLRVADDAGGPGEPTQEQLATLQDMRHEGKLDLVGVSNVTLEGARAAVELEDSLAEIQKAYSVLDRHNEPVLDLCREREIAFVPFFPLGSAFAGVRGHWPPTPPSPRSPPSTAPPPPRWRWRGYWPAMMGSCSSRGPPR